MSSRDPQNGTGDSLFSGITAGLGGVHAKIRVVSLGLLIMLVGLTIGMVLERQLLQGTSHEPDAFADLEAAADIIEEHYYYLPADPEARATLADEMEERAMTGALEALDDAYTRYLPPDESATAHEDLDGRYGGIGVDLAFGEDVVIVANVIPDTPADEAGIKRGDVVEEVDGEQVAGVDPNEVTRMLRGEVGSRIDVTFVRPETNDVIEREFDLEEIVVPPVTLRFIDGTSIAWLRITIFGDTTVEELDAALATIEKRGATGIILDLRGNGGGWVESARATLGRFVDPSLGPAMFEDGTPGPGGLEPLPITAGDGVEPVALPTVVLVDGGTASSAEIVAGALRDYDRSMVIGEPTFGKGSVQRIFGFSDGATMRVTIAEWFTPSRGRIQDQGIQPDVQVSAAPHGSSDDPVLSTAVRLLQQGQSRPSDLQTAAASPVP